MIYHICLEIARFSFSTHSDLRKVTPFHTLLCYCPLSVIALPPWDENGLDVSVKEDKVTPCARTDPQLTLLQISSFPNEANTSSNLKHLHIAYINLILKTKQKGTKNFHHFKHCMFSY